MKVWVEAPTILIDVLNLIVLTMKVHTIDKRTQEIAYDVETPMLQCTTDLPMPTSP